MRNDECCSAARPCCSEVDDRPMMESEYPSKAKAREINIQPMNYGFVVRVGCQSFVFETAEKMIKNLNVYLVDPEGVEKAWLNNAFLL